MTQGQVWDPEIYARNARYVVDMGLPVLELLHPQPSERILDLGCGDGVLTEKIATHGCQVVGVDSSPEQIETAKKLGLDARVVDAEHLPFVNEFDAVFSNAALHWMKRPDPVIEGVWRALKPGGRFVAECGGEGNVAKLREALFKKLKERGIDPHLHNPWYFPSPGDYHARLQKQGFQVKYMELFPKPMTLPRGIVGWLEVFAGAFLAALPEPEHEAFKQEVEEALKPDLVDQEGNLFADYVRLRFKAIKPSM